jgi:hypothetical protein
LAWLTPVDLRSIAERDPEWAVDEYVLNGSRVPFVFREDAQCYAGFLEDVSNRLNVAAACLTVVGSAAVGFCMSPTREYGREFRSESDIDLVVVDEALFDTAWLALRQMYGRTYDLTEQMRDGDPAPNLPSLISRIFSGYGPNWGGLQTRWV